MEIPSHQNDCHKENYQQQMMTKMAEERTL